MNRENVLKLADAIENRKGLKRLGFNMVALIEEATGPWKDTGGRDCGTVACIAGHAFILANNLRQKDWIHGYNGPVMESAGDWLGLTDEQMDDLFLPIGSDRDLCDATPSQAVSCLRHLAETGEVDWDRAITANPIVEGVS